MENNTNNYSFREVCTSIGILSSSSSHNSNNNSEQCRILPLHTGGAQSTLQDIKLPELAGGFFYKDTCRHITRNRFISWHIYQDTFEVIERSLEVRIRNGHLKWKGSGALLGASIHELPKHILILLASVSSVHRFIFPRPEEKGESTLNNEDSYLSILSEASEAQSANPKNNHIISYYTNSNVLAPDTCAISLNNNGDALYALTGSNFNNNGIVLVKLTPTGAIHTSILRQESIVPRFLAAFRSNRNEKESNYGLAIIPGFENNSAKLYALGRDCRIRAWCFEKTTCLADHPLLHDSNENLVQGAQNHVLRYGETSNGALLGIFLCFASENRFIVIKPSQVDQNTIKFVTICNLLGLERYLVDFNLCGNAIWSVWGGGSHGTDTSVTVSTLDSAGSWKLAHLVPSPIPVLQIQNEHEEYLEYLFKPGLFPLTVIAKALSIYERSGECGPNVTRDQSIIEPSEIKNVKKLKDSTLAAVLNVEQKFAGRAQLSSEEIMHKCWSELYSWCVQYLEGWRKPQGLIISQHENAAWCILLQRGGISFLRPMETLEQLFLAGDDYYLTLDNSSDSTINKDVKAVISAASEAAKYTGDEVLSSVRNAIMSGQTPDQIIPEIADHLLSDGEETPPIFTAEIISSIKHKLSQVKDLPSAILALNQALRLDCDDESLENEEKSHLASMFSSDLGVSLVTESLYQMAEIRFSICCNLLILGSILKGSNAHRAWPVSGHTAVSLQAYNALCWLCETTLGDANHQEALKHSIERLSLLKLTEKNNHVGMNENTRVLHSASVAWWFVRSTGGKIARKLILPDIQSLHWSKALLPFVHCLGHLMWGVSGGFSFGSWLAGSGRPKLVLNYAGLLESWCEWNVYSREFIKGMALLDIGEAKKALSSFLYASQGASTESFLMNMLPQDESDGTHNNLLNYYLKVIKLFELHNAPECIISWAETAIGIASKDDPQLPIFHSLMFRTQLELGQWDKALYTANEHPVREQRDNCLARLVAALGSRGGLAQLISPTAPPTPPTLQRLAEQRARTADNPLNHYYNFLYAFYIKRGDMRKAADVMYEQSIRISSELGPGADALSKRVRCLLAAVNCLSLVPSQHAFLVTPCELTASSQGDKRNNEGEVIPPDQDVKVIGLDDLRKELHLVTARLKFANTQPDQLCAETGAEEVACLLSGIGLHTNALSLRVRHELPVAPALATLASAAASIPYPSNTQSETEAWKWLAENEIPELCIGETSASGAAWKLLRALVGQENDYSGHPNENRVSILNAVTSRLLLLGTFLPHWLLHEYKKLDSSSLIRVLVRYGRLAEAASIGMEALRSAKVHAGAPFALRPICAPLASLDVLLAELQHQASLGDIYYVQMYEELNELVRLHCERVQRTSDNLRGDQAIHGFA